MAAAEGRQMRYQLKGGEADGKEVDVPDGVCSISIPCAYKENDLAVELAYQKVQRGSVTSFDYVSKITHIQTLPA